MGAILSEDGTGVGMNELRVPLSRHDLGSVFECRASNEAVEYPLSAKVTLDMNGKSRVVTNCVDEGPSCGLFDRIELVIIVVCCSLRRCRC